MPFGKSLHPHQRTLAAEDRKDRYQQHPPLGKTDAAAHPAVRQRFEKTDQIACSSRRGGGLEGQGTGAIPAHDTVGAANQPALLGQTSNRPCWHTGLSIAEIKAEILKAKPVAVGSLHHGTASAPTGGGHFVVITGFTDSAWLVQDPYGSQDLVNGGFADDCMGAGKDQLYSFKNFNPRIFVEGDGTCWGWTFS